MHHRAQTFLKRLKRYEYGYKKYASEDQAVIDEIESYIKGEKTLEESFDFISQNLKGQTVNGTKVYRILECEGNEKSMGAIAKSYESSDEEMRIARLIIALNPYQAIESFSASERKGGCNFKSVKIHDDMIENIKSKFDIEQKYLDAWSLGFFHRHYTCGPVRAQIFEKTRKRMKENLEDALAVKEVLSVIDDDSMLGVASVLYDITGDEEINDYINEIYSKRFGRFLRKSYSHDEEQESLIEKYMNSEIEFKDIEDLFSEKYRLGEEERKEYLENNFWALEIGKRKKYMNIFSKAFYDSFDYYLWKSLKDSKREFKRKMRMYMDEILESSAGIKSAVEFAAMGIAFYYDYLDSTKGEYESALNYILKLGHDPVKHIGNLPVEAKIALISSVVGAENMSIESADSCVDHIKDKSKKVREIAVSKLSGLGYESVEPSLEKLSKLADDKKADTRIAAISILSNHPDEERVREILNERFKKESDPKARSIIIESLNIDVREIYKDEDGNFNLEMYISETTKGKKSKKSTVDMSGMTKIRYKESGDFIEDHVIGYFIDCYRESDELSVNKDALLISQYMDEKDLVAFSKDMLDYFVEHGYDNKKKWIVLLSCVHGDYELINRVQKLITTLAANSKQKMASYVVKALAFNGSRQALTIVDSISRKFKYKSVKESAVQSFDIVANEMGYSVGELQDRIVPDLGFTGASYKEYDYGSRSFKVFLGDDLSLVIQKEDKKTVKSLPKANASDDEEKVQAAKDDFKLLKKELKDAVKSQTERFEMALSDFRMWSVDSWKALFMQNPIMNRLGKKVVWGQYEGTKLVKAFVYDDDFYDFEDCEVGLEERFKISIVHPLELSDEQKDGWREFLKDHEIDQPFEQIDRKVFICEDPEMESVTQFKYNKINDRTIVGRIEKNGWYKGSITDGGGYNEFYKENRQIGIGAEITFDEYLGVYGLGYEDVAVKTIEFYKAGSIERGSYVYDQVDDKRRIKPIDVPGRYYSEMVYDIYKAAGIEEQEQNGVVS